MLEGKLVLIHSGKIGELSDSPDYHVLARVPNSLKYLHFGHRNVMSTPEVHRILVTFDEDQMGIIRSLKGFGTEDAEIIRSVVWLI